MDLLRLLLLLQSCLSHALQLMQLLLMPLIHCFNVTIARWIGTPLSMHCNRGWCLHHSASQLLVTVHHDAVLDTPRVRIVVLYQAWSALEAACRSPGSSPGRCVRCT
jgi:hypothetical protein